MAGKEAGERFWEWALPVYGRDAAHEAFLRLQDEGGADVPMLLWCLWRGAERSVVSREVMAQATGFSESWRREAVTPLRTLRRNMKNGIADAPAALTEEARALVVRVEQGIERMQMTTLASFPADPCDAAPQDAARSNIALYADVAGWVMMETECRAILASAFR